MNLGKELSNKIIELGSTMSSQISDDSKGDFFSSLSNLGNEFAEKNENYMMNKKIKKSEITNQLSDKKFKMDKPIGKLFSGSKSENKEATSSGSAGVFSPALSGEMKEKWSKKYKDSIDCNNPKGFSQRAHCASKGKKTETKEATSSASAGVYDAPGFEDVKMKGNHPIGSGSSFKNTQIPNGSFVKVKEKCKKFPYCNQGDINALTITKPKKKKKKKKKTISEMIKDASIKYNINENIIIEMLIKEFNTNK